MPEMLQKFLSSKVVTRKIHTQDESSGINGHRNQHIFIFVEYSSTKKLEYWAQPYSQYNCGPRYHQVTHSKTKTKTSRQYIRRSQPITASFEH